MSTAKHMWREIIRSTAQWTLVTDHHQPPKDTSGHERWSAKVKQTPLVFFQEEKPNRNGQKSKARNGCIITCNMLPAMCLPYTRNAITNSHQQLTDSQYLHTYRPNHLNQLPGNDSPSFRETFAGWEIHPMMEKKRRTIYEHGTVKNVHTKKFLKISNALHSTSMVVPNRQRNTFERKPPLPSW